MLWQVISNYRYLMMSGGLHEAIFRVEMSESSFQASRHLKIVSLNNTFGIVILG